MAQPMWSPALNAGTPFAMAAWMVRRIAAAIPQYDTLRQSGYWR
jgi:hypothetical protein